MDFHLSVVCYGNQKTLKYATNLLVFVKPRFSFYLHKNSLSKNRGKKLNLFICGWPPTWNNFFVKWTVNTVYVKRAQTNETNENATKLFGRRFTGNWNFESNNSNRHRVLEHDSSITYANRAASVLRAYLLTSAPTASSTAPRWSLATAPLPFDLFSFRCVHFGFRIAGGTFAARKQTREGATRRVEPTKQRMAG